MKDKKLSVPLKRIGELASIVSGILSSITAFYDLSQTLRDKENISTFTVIVIVVGTVMFMLSLYYIFSFSKGKREKLKYPKLSIIRIMETRKASEISKNTSMIMLSILGYILLFRYLKVEISIEAIYIGFVTVILLGVHKFLFDYRVKSGYYGNNEREAREIIQFILQESEHIDFTDNGKLKKIVSDEELGEIAESIKSLLPQVG